MATFSPYNAGGYERQKSSIEHDYGTQMATNSYGRFLGQQRGERGLGDTQRGMQRQFPGFKAGFGQRGLQGSGISSGVQQRSMQDYLGDYTRDYGRQQQVMTQRLQQYDQQAQQLGAFRQQSLADLEAEKAQAIANDAAALEYLRNLVGGL